MKHVCLNRKDFENHKGNFSANKPTELPNKKCLHDVAGKLKRKQGEFSLSRRKRRKNLLMAKVSLCSFIKRSPKKAIASAPDRETSASTTQQLPKQPRSQIQTLYTDSPIAFYHMAYLVQNTTHSTLKTRAPMAPLIMLGPLCW